MKTELDPPPVWEATRSGFIEVGGNTTQSFGFGRIVGQIYALLYLSPRSLCLDEIADELHVSKASVSVTVRQLEGWSAVKRVWVKGDRRDFYEAESDFRAMLRSGVLSRIRRKLETSGVQLDQAEDSLKVALDTASDEERKDLEMVAGRLRHAKEFHNKLNTVLTDPLRDAVLGEV